MKKQEFIFDDHEVSTNPKRKLEVDNALGDDKHSGWCLFCSGCAADVVGAPAFYAIQDWYNET